MAMTVVYYCMDGEILAENRGGIVTHLIPDTLGSVIETRDDAGNKTSETTYWPYGEVRTQTGTNPTPWGFVGSWGCFKDAGSRLYVRARYYRQKEARWHTLDPLWPDESAYGYVNNSPVVQSDPSGRQSRGCPRHGGEPGCVFSGPPGSESDPAYWHCQTPYPDSPRPVCLACLDGIYHRTGKAYKGPSGFPNAMRHCVGTCLANQECGQSCASLVILHEIQSWFTDDSRRDRHNNEVGHSIGRIRPQVDCHKKCGQAYREGRLL